MKIDKETILKQFKESPTIKARCYIFRQLKELYGKAFKAHYLIRDDMVDQYYFDYQEEIDAMFPGNHI